MEETLRKNLIDTINELNKLLYLTTNKDEISLLRKKRRLCFTLLEEVIEQEIPNNSSGFDDAIEALKEATQMAKEAKTDINKIAETIKKVSLATKKVEKIVKIGIDIIT